MHELSDITFVIPTHNRSGYLSRILEYYWGVPLKIIIVDSSTAAFDVSTIGPEVSYYHLKDMPMPKKIEYALSLVRTKFVVMCADDDFIIPAGIVRCINFLKEHPSFNSAQGSSITYKKRNKYTGFIEFNLLYTGPSEFEIASGDPFERLHRLFHPYRTIFSAVHHTENLLKGYRDLDKGIRNLFLNEYITAIIPIVCGSHKELPVFYQLREYADNSGDKTTDNLEVIMRSEKYSSELAVFLAYISGRISEITGISAALSKEKLFSTLSSFADELDRAKRSGRNAGASKKIGNLLKAVPIVGERLVLARRLKQQQQSIRKVVRTEEDHAHLEELKKLIYKYGEAVA
jgi:glycosyltransferase domain-containing protein